MATSKQVYDNPTAGFIAAPVLLLAILIIARRVHETARHDKKPYLVGLVFPVFTSKQISTKTNVHVASIWNASKIDTEDFG